MVNEQKNGYGYEAYGVTHKKSGHHRVVLDEPVKMDEIPFSERPSYTSRHLASRKD